MILNITEQQAKFLIILFQFIDHTGFFATTVSEMKDIIEQIKNEKEKEKKNL